MNSMGIAQWPDVDITLKNNSAFYLSGGFTHVYVTYKLNNVKGFFYLGAMEFEGEVTYIPSSSFGGSLYERKADIKFSK